MKNYITGGALKKIIDEIIEEESTIVYAIWNGEIILSQKSRPRRICSNCNQLREVDNFCSCCGARMKNVLEKTNWGM